VVVNDHLRCWVLRAGVGEIEVNTHPYRHAPGATVFRVRPHQVRAPLQVELERWQAQERRARQLDAITIRLRELASEARETDLGRQRVCELLGVPWE
jgi:hypothetical protein